MIINTTGPWVDDVCKLGVKNNQSSPIGKTKKIGGTKGSHIMVDSFPGAPETALYVEAKSDGRPFFIVPFLSKYLIGTTDYLYKGKLDNIKANNEEIDYLLQETNFIIPTANLTRESVNFTYSGVRPLPNAEGKTAGSITRQHILFNHQSEGVNNLISLIGGKLTTYRHVGEEVVNLVLKKRKKLLNSSPTKTKPLPGSILPTDERIDKAIATYSPSISLDSIDYLFSTYGAKAVEVLKLTEEYPELGAKISPHLPHLRAEIVYAVRYELAYTITDICRRRTFLAIYGNYGFDFLDVIADILHKYCNWTQEECDRACDDYKTYMRENCIPDYELNRHLGDVSSSGDCR
jgi:glycerol-3-phosphate dehydrogenase